MEVDYYQFASSFTAKGQGRMAQNSYQLLFYGIYHSLVLYGMWPEISEPMDNNSLYLKENVTEAEKNASYLENFLE